MRFLIPYLMLAVPLFLPTTARASTFNVNPTRLTLSQTSHSALLTIRNTSSETLRFQLEVFEWAQKVNGEVDLRPTQDVIFFPRIVKLGAEQNRKVRVGLKKNAKPKTRDKKGKLRELTYRIIVQELPSRRRKDNTEQIRVLTRMSIPIFLTPKDATAKLSFKNPSVQRGNFVFRVQNQGSKHALMGPITLRALGSNHREILKKKLQGWYVLGHDSRRYELALPKVLCKKIKILEVKSSIDEKTLKLRHAMGSGACHEG